MSISKAEADPPANNVLSALYRDWLRRERRSHLAVRTTQFGLLAVFLLAWEILPRMQMINPLFTSYPSALWPTFVELLHATPPQVSIITHTWATVRATVIGFATAMMLGTLLAGALWWWNGVYKVLDPYLVVANAMPKIAFVPVFYIWFGPTLSIYVMALIISLFITVLMIYNGFQSVDPNKIRLVETFGGTRRQILAKVVLPGSVPTLIAALKINAGLSLVGVVVGEFQSANTGLGYLIQYGSQIFRFNVVMTAVTLLALVSSTMYLAISWIETAVIRRR